MNFFKLVFFLLLTTSSCAQQEPKPFYNDIQAFKKADKKNAPPKNAILFVGSSSFAMWKDVQDYFPGYTIINRGFGGSTLTQAIDYADDIIVPYRPKQVVIYSGENDVAGGNVTADDVEQRFITLFKKIRAELPDAHVAYISMKPSPSREKLLPVMRDGNAKIKDYLAKEKNAVFVDVFSLMLDSAGNPRPELFIEDMLHMNKKGYEIWKGVITPVLVK